MFIVLFKNNRQEIRNIYYIDKQKNVYLLTHSSGTKEYQTNCENFLDWLSELRELTDCDVYFATHWTKIQKKFSSIALNEHWIEMAEELQMC